MKGENTENINITKITPSLYHLVEGESADPQKVCELVYEEIGRLIKEGIDAERFEIDKRVRYGEKVSSINDVKACAEAMLYYRLDSKELTLFDDLDIIASLTVQECNSMISELFDIQRSSLSIVTNKQ